MKKFKSVNIPFSKNTLAEVTTSPLPFWKRSGKALVSHKKELNFGYLCKLTSNKYFDFTKQVICKNDEMSNLKSGDCILLTSDGYVNLVWDAISHQNVLFITEACNCNCLMCPQPPQKHSQEHFKTSIQLLSLINPDSVSQICITGGEPTLFDENFFSLIEIATKRFPNVHFILLTNGKKFSDFEFTKKFMSYNPTNIVPCISIHSDIDTIHDVIVGAKGSFEKTVQGIRNLAKFRQPTELRFVINKMNFERIEQFSTFAYRNFPFIAHFAFMGLEITGHARENYDLIWIDPYEYKEHLAAAIHELDRRALQASVYNVSHCLVDESIRAFCKQSISSWKNNYIEICNECDARDICCGFFATSGEYISPRIKCIRK